jgi:carboxypeptidase C (cathepsin A)
MKHPFLLAAAALLATTAAAEPVKHHVKPGATHPPKAEGATEKKADASQPAKGFFKPTEVRSTGTVTVGGQPIAYDAIAGTLVVHSKDWSDTDAVEADAASSGDKDKSGPKPEASMYYVAYFKQGAPAAARPITFLFNGGPGSSPRRCTISSTNRTTAKCSTISSPKSRRSRSSVTPSRPSGAARRSSSPAASRR